VFCDIGSIMRILRFDRRWKRSGWRVVFLVLICIGTTFYLLFHLQQRAFAKRTHCVSNLVHIRMAKVLYQEEFKIPDGATIPVEVFERFFEQVMAKPLGQYKCLCGGKYEIGPAGIMPACSYTGICYTYQFDWRRVRLERRAWRHSLEP